MLISSCSTNVTKLTPYLSQECDEYLPLLEEGNVASILQWKVEADDVYAECKDKYKALLEVIGD
jgi:hypothetical protein